MVQTTNQLLDIYKQKTTDVPYFPPESILPCPQKSTRFPPKKNPPKKKKSPPSCRHPRPQAGDEVLQVGHGDVARGAAAWRDRTGR